MGAIGTAEELARPLVQLHWQDRSDPTRTEFVAQGGPFDRLEDFEAWVNDLIRRRGPEMPEGWCPMVCTQGSEHFVLAAPR